LLPVVDIGCACCRPEKKPAGKETDRLGRFAKTRKTQGAFSFPHPGSLLIPDAGALQLLKDLFKSDDAE
jgi:hypothetical protein